MAWYVIWKASNTTRTYETEWEKFHCSFRKLSNISIHIPIPICRRNRLGYIVHEPFRKCGNLKPNIRKKYRIISQLWVRCNILKDVVTDPNHSQIMTFSCRKNFQSMLMFFGAIHIPPTSPGKACSNTIFQRLDYTSSNL